MAAKKTNTKKGAKGKDKVNAPYDRDALIAACNDMTKIMQLQPPLYEGDDMSDDDLLAAVKEGAEMADKADKFKKETWDLLGVLGIGPKASEEEKEEKPKKKPAQKKKATPKKKAKKEEKPEEEEKEEVDETEPEEEEKPKKKTEKKNSVTQTRVSAFCKVLKTTQKKPATIEKIVESTIDICSKNGLKSSAKFESVSWILNHYMAPLIELGVVSFDNKTKKYSHTSN